MLIAAIARPAKRLLRTSIVDLVLTVPLLAAQGAHASFQGAHASFQGADAISALVVLAVRALSLRKLARPRTVLLALRHCPSPG